MDRGPSRASKPDPDARPRFYPARSVPYALRDLVNKQLQRLQEEGTLEPVEISEWATPLVAVLKHDKKSVRICGDFRITVNPVSKLDRYPIPKIEDLFARLRKGRYFTNLDLSQAYQQLPINDDSKKFVVVNTHRGIFRYTRLPFGIASAPGIFIESVLQGIDGVVVYLDDILISGSTEENHLDTLDELLSRLYRAGLRVKRSKCEFMKTYLGHQIDGDGLQTRLGPSEKPLHQQQSQPSSLTLGCCRTTASSCPTTLLICNHSTPCSERMSLATGEQLRRRYSTSQRSSSHRQVVSHTSTLR